MSSEIEDQIIRIKNARLRLDAELMIGRSMLPEICRNTLHYSGAKRAMEGHPQYTHLIKEISK